MPRLASMEALKASLVAVLLLIAGMAPDAFAEGPAGFAGFAWGTPRQTMVDQFAKARCSWHMTMTTLRGRDRIVCRGYQVQGVGTVYLTLDFIDDGFRGYRIAVRRDLAGKLKAQAPEIVGAPAASTGPWKSHTDISEAGCMAGWVCLGVTTE
jgi:hypothetical protein